VLLDLLPATANCAIMLSQNHRPANWHIFTFLHPILLCKPHFEHCWRRFQPSQMEQLFLQNESGMLGWKVVSHNDLPIRKGVWDADKVDLRENFDHVWLIFFVGVKFHIVVKFLKSFCYKFNDYSPSCPSLFHVVWKTP